MEPRVIYHHFGAEAPPTSEDDERRHFHHGSLWYGEGWAHFYLCLDARAGAAVWRPLPLVPSIRSILPKPVGGVLN